MSITIKPSDPNQGQRFHLHPSIRIPLVCLTTGLFGFINGARTGFITASDRYFIENLHRLPTTKGEWYFYHKRKNVVVLKSALNSGFKKSFKLSVIGCSYFGTEAMLDYTRGKIDFLNSLVTTVTFGWIYAKWYNMNSFNTRKSLLNGVLIGLSSGVVQDLMIYLRGHEDLWYVKAGAQLIGKKPFAA